MHSLSDFFEYRLDSISLTARLLLRRGCGLRVRIWYRDPHSDVLSLVAQMTHVLKERHDALTWTE
jgi:hypothetical protein